jgi:hypothetical protein
MVNVIGGPFFDQAVGQISDNDGSLNGWRTDVRLANFAQGALPGGNTVSFGASGFFANYQGTTTSHCMYSLTTDCAIVNIVDFDPAQPHNTGPFGNLNVTVKRDVTYWGLSLDGRLGDGPWGGLKDPAAAQNLSPFKIGVAVRGIAETGKLTSTDPLVSDPVKYKETVNAHYYGGYAGVEKTEPLGAGWSIGVDATAGVYYTTTDYQGRYNGYTVQIPVFVQDYGYVNESSDKGSFIGTVRLDLKRQFNWGSAGVYGQGEYFSYVPRIAYNNNDVAGGPPFGIIGNQTGTRIAGSDAFNFTAGLNLSIPVN